MNVVDLITQNSAISIKSLNQFCPSYKVDEIPNVGKAADTIMKYYHDIDNIDISINGNYDIDKQLVVALNGKSDKFKNEVQTEVNRRIDEQYGERRKAQRKRQKKE